MSEEKNRELRIGLLGGGRIGKLHGTNLQNEVAGVRVAKLADPFLNDKMQEWAESIRIPVCTTDPEEVFRDPEIDAVFICSSTNTHAEFIIRAAEAGKDIFCEKPIATDIGQIHAALDAVEKAGVKLQVGFVRRFDRSHNAVREAVASGQLGKPYMVKITSRDPAGPSMEYVKVSGGIFMDMAIHDFDMARFLSGSEVTEVSAAGAVLTDPRYADYGDVDTAITTLRFANGAIGVIDNCRQAPYGYDQRVEVLCEKGSVQDDNHLENEAKISTADGVTSAKPTWFFLERYNDAFIEEEKAFVRAVNAGDSKAERQRKSGVRKNAVSVNTVTDEPDQNGVPVTGHDGLEAVRIAMAAKKSLEEHRPVSMSEILE